MAETTPDRPSCCSKCSGVMIGASPTPDAIHGTLPVNQLTEAIDATTPSFTQEQWANFGRFARASTTDANFEPSKRYQYVENDPVDRVAEGELSIRTEQLRGFGPTVGSSQSRARSEAELSERVELTPGFRSTIHARKMRYSTDASNIFIVPKPAEQRGASQASSECD